VWLNSYAKINLFLEVLGKLPDNYHQIETLLCSVSLYDTLKFVLTKSPTVELWSNLPELTVENNLVFRVADNLRKRFKPQMGVMISLEKNIPLAAGLGGGSSNAATTIRALNSLWNLNLRLDEMERIAAEFGSDIPFFLHGGCAWGTHRGEKVEPMPFVALDLLLVNPGIGISSSKAYGLLSQFDYFDRRQWNPAAGTAGFYNRLEHVVRQTYPVVDRLLEELTETGAKVAMMSGSGPTCFGIYEDATLLKAGKDYFDVKGYSSYIVRSISREESHFEV
jgi:4-diphosphocytidyl-2-C-methyl-D-erythritol kinase